VVCGNDFTCPYTNYCEANLAGFVESQCRPLNAAGCPVPGTGSSAGEACTADENPVRCGLYYQCVYSNECVANSVGFLAGCAPLADGEPANPIEPVPSNPVEEGDGNGNVPTTNSEQTDTSAGVVLAVGNLAIAAFFSTVFF